MKQMKISWRYHYVEEGDNEPDERGRWLIKMFIYGHIDKSLPEAATFKPLFGKYIPICFGTIQQVDKDKLSEYPELNRYYIRLPSVGVSDLDFFIKTLSSNDVEELKQDAEKEVRRFQSILMYAEKG